MDKIAVIALKSMYSEDVLDLLAELIVNSRNPTVALESALDIYELPDLTIGNELLNSTTRANIQFISFNKYEESVTFGYNKVDNEYAWTNNETGIVVSTKESSYYAKDIVGMTTSEFEEKHTRSITKTTVSDKITITNIALTTWNK